MSDLLKQIHKKKGKPPVPAADSDSDEESKEQVAELYPESNFKGPIMPTQSFQPSQTSHPPLPKPKPKSQLSKYSPLPWNNYFDTMEYILDGVPIYTAGANQNPEGPVFVCIHGAGYSGLSFAHLAKYVKQFAIIVAMDLRGHYQNKQTDPTNLSKDQLIDDIEKIMSVLVEKYTEQSFLIVGHSMGGSIACFATEKISNSSPFKDRIAGLVVIDVVEGTAMEALPFMEQIVKSKPKQFQHVEEAVSYVIRTQEIKNIESARISVPATVKEENNIYTWRVNLMQSEEHWKSWFKGLTTSFLSQKIPKILFLAEKDRMDKELTIAQMQGKFKLMILYGVGHVMHEDDPFQTARALWDFLDCFRIPLNEKEKQWIKTNGIGKFHPELKQAPGKK